MAFLIQKLGTRLGFAVLSVQLAFAPVARAQNISRDFALLRTEGRVSPDYLARQLALKEQELEQMKRYQAHQITWDDRLRELQWLNAVAYFGILVAWLASGIFDGHYRIKSWVVDKASQLSDLISKNNNCDSSLGKRDVPRLKLELKDRLLIERSYSSIFQGSTLLGFLSWITLLSTEDKRKDLNAHSEKMEQEISRLRFNIVELRKIAEPSSPPASPPPISQPDALLEWFHRQMEAARNPNDKLSNLVLGNDPTLATESMLNGAADRLSLWTGQTSVAQMLSSGLDLPQYFPPRGGTKFRAVVFLGVHATTIETHLNPKISAPKNLYVVPLEEKNRSRKISKSVFHRTLVIDSSSHWMKSDNGEKRVALDENEQDKRVEIGIYPAFEHRRNRHLSYIYGHDVPADQESIFSSDGLLAFISCNLVPDDPRAAIVTFRELAYLFRMRSGWIYANFTPGFAQLDRMNAPAQEAPTALLRLQAMMGLITKPFSKPNFERLDRHSGGTGFFYGHVLGGEEMLIKGNFRDAMMGRIRGEIVLRSNRY